MYFTGLYILGQTQDACERTINKDNRRTRMNPFININYLCKRYFVLKWSYRQLYVKLQLVFVCADLNGWMDVCGDLIRLFLKFNVTIFLLKTGLKEKIFWF